MKKILAFVLAQLAGLIFISWAGAATCILLTATLTRPYYATHACLSNVDWQPMSKQFATRLSYGYSDDKGWHETGDLHSKVENNTKEPVYDNAMAVVNSANLQQTKLEAVIIGLIQASGGPAGSIVEIP